jgi:hypothetical protein
MIAVLADPHAGGTFLTWSLHYLAGHKKYYNAKIQSWEPLVDNPVTTINAHGFTPNLSTTVDMFNRLLNAITKTPTDTFHTMYLHNTEFITKDKIVSSYNAETVACITKIMEVVNKRIVLTTKQEHSLYHSKYTQRMLTQKWTDQSTFNKTNDEQHNDFINFFFNESQQVWSQQQLDNIWDRREFLALNCRPFNIIRITPNINLTQNHYTIDTFDLYNTFDESVIALFDYLEVKIDRSNLNLWYDVYQTWRKIHFNRLIFVWYFDQIINYIIHGYDMDLSRFNLDIVQEATIQHYLIYKHNLNLKTWQLEKFKNTKQLHNLLEPNTHLLGNY